MHKLMVKTHITTGIKYLCYTQMEGEAYDAYKGSGTTWLQILTEHGDDISTELIFESTDYDTFRAYAIKKSEEWNVKLSPEWANNRYETGTGGDTVSDKVWITDGTVDKYHPKTDPIPEGWKRGRSRCVFNDYNKQKEFASRVDRSKTSERLKKAWAEGRFVRDNSKIGRSGDANVAKRPEVREKIANYTRTEETKQKMSAARKGKTLYTDGNVRKFFVPGQQPEGWVQGKRK